MEGEEEEEDTGAGRTRLAPLRDAGFVLKSRRRKNEGEGAGVTEILQTTHTTQKLSKRCMSDPELAGELPPRPGDGPFVLQRVRVLPGDRGRDGGRR